MELILHGLSEFEIINKDILENNLTFRDVLADMLRNEMMEDDDDDEDDEDFEDDDDMDYDFDDDDDDDDDRYN